MSRERFAKKEKQKKLRLFYSPLSLIQIFVDHLIFALGTIQSAVGYSGEQDRLGPSSYRVYNVVSADRKPAVSIPR